MADDKLEAYKSKRDPSKTGEPFGASPPGKRGVGSAGPQNKRGNRFVIQKHDASRLHYDFRLEVDGVLKSWAVPKGPSTDPRDKRLAMPTEDHPLDYIDFEGNIPKDQYGGGSVIVWDAGTYRNLSQRKGEEVPIADALNNGHATVWLEGHKLTGGYAITRTGPGEKPRWLLVKMKDEAADARRNPINTQPESVISGLTNDELAREADA